MFRKKVHIAKECIVPPGTRFVSIRLSFDAFEEASPKDSVIFIEAFDSLNKAVRISDTKLFHNERFANWFYLNAEKGQSECEFGFEIAEPIARLKVGFHDWEGARLSNKRVICQEVFTGDPSEANCLGASKTNPVPIDKVNLEYSVVGNDQYKFTWETDSAQGDALFLFTFIDENGQQLPPIEILPVHRELGAYVYAAKGKNANLEKALCFKSPMRAKKLCIRGKKWAGDEVSLVSSPVLEAQKTNSNQRQAIQSFVEGISQEDKVLILYTTAGPLSEKNKLLLRSNRLAVDCSEHGWKVVLVPFAKVDGVEHAHMPLPGILQISEEELLEVVDQLLLKEALGPRVFVCSSRSDLNSIGIQNRLQDGGWKTVYEIRDDMEEFNRVGFSKWYRPSLEVRFAKQADGILATAPRLAERISVLSGRKDVVRIPNAGPDWTIDEAEFMRSVESFSNNRTRPIVGYLGHMTAAWFDWQNLIEVAKSNPQFKFEIIGPGVPEDLYLPSNMVALGKKTHEECISIVKHWRVGLIPFIKSRLTYGVDPNKVYEYIAFGLQTVSAPMGDVETMPGVHVYQGLEEFNLHLREAMAFVPDEEFFERCEEFLKVSRWTARGKAFRDYLERI